MDYIAFPNLGWRFEVSPFVVEDLFGAISIKWYGLLIALGFLLAVIYALRRCKSMGIDPDRMIDVTLVTTLCAFVGARLYYVLFSGDASYFSDPLKIFRIWEGGLAIYGGIIVAFVVGIITTRWRKVNTLAMFDLASLGFLIGQGIGRWGNFFNQEAFGGNTADDFFLGMTGNIIQKGSHGEAYATDGLVHPTFLYESLWCLLGFVVLHFLSKRLFRQNGQVFASYLIWYGCGRFFIESLRTDSLYVGDIRVSQLVAAVAVLGGVALLLILRAKSKMTPKDLFEQEESALAVAEGEAPVAEETVVSVEAEKEE